MGDPADGVGVVSQEGAQPRLLGQAGRRQMHQAALAQRLDVLAGHPAGGEQRAPGVLDRLFEGPEVLVAAGDGEGFGLRAAVRNADRKLSPAEWRPFRSSRATS